MRYLSHTAASYFGFDLQARTMHLCVFDAGGSVRLSHNLAARPRPFLDAIAPFRPNLVVGMRVHALVVLARGRLSR